ncbi:hypothetical protein P4O66_007417 [Electrophorus voltai]|uniref:Uncharacterized protein n=1 Tax=Electrophorus voltai TaxID=2609070 RepID=A0AAD8ZJB7_9TELE|nr:hypothetical protein P4O66_007417 [Electrophorus voltai]
MTTTDEPRRGGSGRDLRARANVLAHVSPDVSCEVAHSCSTVFQHTVPLLQGGVGFGRLASEPGCCPVRWSLLLTFVSSEIPHSSWCVWRLHLSLFLSLTASFKRRCPIAAHASELQMQ